MTRNGLGCSKNDKLSSWVGESEKKPDGRRHGSASLIPSPCHSSSRGTPVWYRLAKNRQTQVIMIVEDGLVPNRRPAIGNYHVNSYLTSGHYGDVIMSAMASQITSLTIVYWTFYSGADQRKHQNSVSLAFVRGIHRWPVNSPHERPVTRKMFPFDDVIMSWDHITEIIVLLSGKTDSDLSAHDDPMIWTHFLHYWPFVTGIHKLSVVSFTHKVPIIQTVPWSVGGDASTPMWRHPDEPIASYHDTYNQ